MIDLRSDTLTKPTEEMRRAMYIAEVGDDGRTSLQGKGEDPTVNKLEEQAAKVTGKEDALFCSSGSQANIIALLTHCKRGDAVVIGETSHINQSEKLPFMEEYYGLNPKFFLTVEYGLPNSESVNIFLREDKVSLLCLENSNSFESGTCMTVEQTAAICALSNRHNVPVHLDGARIFNVAAHYNLPVANLVSSVDSIMFCLSKGLGAPVGSMLCGSKEFIKRARTIRKLLGGGMRQAGIIAAAGIISIQSNSKRLIQDNENAYFLATQLAHNECFKLDLASIQTNIVTLDISASGYTSQYFESELAKRGLKVKSTSDRHIRMTTYAEIHKRDVVEAAKIINVFCKSLN